MNVKQLRSDRRDVQAVLYYSKSMASNKPNEKWFMDTISCPNGTKISNFENVPILSTINDLRGRESEFILDKNGFQPLTSPSSIDQELLVSEDAPTIEKYYNEIENILKSKTGASRVVCIDYTVRKNDSNLEVRYQPVMRVHIDQTPISAHARIIRHVNKPQSFKRFQIINVWRPLINTVWDYPLAVADFRTLDLTQDLEPIDLFYPPWVKDKETYGVKYNPKHQWYYWSHMTPDEILFIKCYDSSSQRLAATPGGSQVFVDQNYLADVSGLCPHTAFLDEEGALTGIRRQSIEVRSLVFYD